MNVVFKERKEVIQVLHNNVEDLKKNLFQLKEEGWTDNTRGSIREEIQEEDIENVKQSYPDIEIQYPTKGGFSTLPYLLLTQHERTIE